MAAFFAIDSFSVHLFDLNGFGYSGGKRFNPDHHAITDNFLTILNNLNKNLPLFGQVISLRTRIRGDFLLEVFDPAPDKRIGTDTQLALD
jgi:hypothetical protein